MNNLREPINNIEKTFDNKLGHSIENFCCKLNIFSQIISVLIILDAFLFLLKLRSDGVPLVFYGE